MFAHTRPIMEIDMRWMKLPSVVGSRLALSIGSTSLDKDSFDQPPGSKAELARTSWRKADIELTAGQRIFAPSTKETEHPSRDLTYSDVLRPVSGMLRRHP
jgi:hypothetical protein